MPMRDQLSALAFAASVPMSTLVTEREPSPGTKAQVPLGYDAGTPPKQGR